MTLRIAILLFSVFGLACIAVAEEQMVADESKRRVERPVKAFVADAILPAPKPQVDRGKAVIEAPAKRILVQAKPVPPDHADISKYDIELPPSQILVEASDKRVKENATDRSFKKVAPGKVQWYKDFAAAVEMSKVSNKPVLLFQLLGQLDEEFT